MYSNQRRDSGLPVREHSVRFPKDAIMGCVTWTGDFFPDALQAAFCRPGMTLPSVLEIQEELWRITLDGFFDILISPEDGSLTLLQAARITAA